MNFEKTYVKEVIISTQHEGRDNKHTIKRRS